ncbi:MAG: myo-inosose-2 dehydratase [Deltaproteobacteria bacterium]|nr:myo-inosose-2 dehydratase [Deltaproteobacteria bacterium]
MAIRFGVNPIVWSNDDLRTLGGETPLETCLSEARQAGYDGIELGHKFPRQAAELKPILDAHGLALVSGWYSGNLLERTAADEIEAMRPHFELLQALGCQVLIFAETTSAVHGDVAMPLSRRPRFDDRIWPVMGERMTQVGDWLQRQGMRLAYHHHMGTVVQTEDEVDRLMTMTGESVGLLLDTGHLAYAGGDPLAVARRWASRIAHVHLKDVRRRVLGEMNASDAPFLRAVPGGVFTVPGDGDIDYPPIFEALAGADYGGWLVVEAEQDPERAHPFTYARKGYQNSVAYARGAGLLS